MLTWMAARQSPHAPVAQAGSGLRVAAAIGLAVLGLQIALGGWVSTNYAVLACSEFPACQGGWWPAMDWRQGFELWRHLGMTGRGEPIAFEALTAIHYAHRLAAYLVLPALALRRGRSAESPAPGTPLRAGAG